MIVSKESTRLKWIESIASLMDDKFRIPGTNFRFGLDPVLGLIPFAGDATSFLISAGLVITMARHGASKKVIILMVLNVMLDAIISSIPFIGKFFDFQYKANRTNINLLKSHYEEGKYQGNGSGIIWTIVLTFIAFFIILVYGTYKLVLWLMSYL